MQSDEIKTKAELLDELRKLRQRNIELKALVAARTELEENLRNVSETALDAVIIADQDGNLVYWNKTAAEIFGYEAEEVLGKPITMLIVDESVDEYNEGKSSVLERGISTFGKSPKESLAKRKDGTIFPAEFTVSNWRIGDKYYFGGSLRDISEQKQAEALLIASEKRFRGIFDFAIEGILIADAQNRKFYDGNNAICRMLGYSREELVTLSTENIHPAEYLPSVVEHFDSMVKGDSSYVLELPTVRKDGSVFYTDLTAHPMHFDGQDCLVGFFRDVSERKQLQEERDRILNMSQDFICIAGMDGYFKFVNPAGERLLGYSREELLARPFLDFIYPEDHSKNDAALERLSSDNILSDFENRYVCKDGSIRNFSWTAAALSEKGLIYCVGRDITERKRAEQVVITTKEFLESVYNTIPDVLVVTDGKGYITNINKAVDKLLGFCQQEMVGKHISELFPKDEKYDQIRTQMMSELRKKGEIKSLEANWIKKDGILCSVELNIAMLQDNNGNNMGGLAVVRDITERKRHAEQLQEREERFRTIAETSNDAIIAADIRGKVLYWNKAAETMYGYTKSEILGKSIELLRPEGKRLTDRKNRNEFIKTGQSPYVGKTVEGMARKKDGTEFPCETSTSFWTMGDQIIFCGIVRDITERKEMEAQIKKSHRELEKKVKQRTAELKKSNDQLQISQEYLKKFAGMLLSAREEERKNISTVMHDELGSMAIAVDSQISIAKEECNENNKQATFTALTNAQTALRKAVGDLRRLAVDLRPPNLDIMGLPAALTDLIDKAKENTKLKIIFRNETGDKKIPGETAIVIYRVIQEGLTNVIKHAKAQSIRVRLYADTKNINLDIADDGIGCTLKKVLYGKRKPSIGILGMRERVESLGGEFTITSAPQKGTQLKVALPKKL